MNTEQTRIGSCYSPGDILGLASTADRPSIVSTFCRLVRDYHPDVNPRDGRLPFINCPAKYDDPLEALILTTSNIGPLPNDTSDCELLCTGMIEPVALVRLAKMHLSSTRFDYGHGGICKPGRRRSSEASLLTVPTEKQSASHGSRPARLLPARAMCYGRILARPAHRRNGRRSHRPTRLFSFRQVGTGTVPSVLVRRQVR